MPFDLQKANMGKRISAWLFDSILLAVLAVCLGLLLSALLGYDSYSLRLDEIYTKYETENGISFSITQEEYDALTDAQRSRYDAAAQALSTDKEAVYNLNMIIQLTLIILTMGILLAYLILEFLVPMLLKNGQTLGKKIFGIAVMKNNGVRINTMSLFIRTVLGKFTIETMIPVLMLLMILWGTIGVLGPGIIGAILLLQVILMLTSESRAPIHDRLANTVTVDMQSQLIFDSEEALIEFKKMRHAEEASKKVC